MLGLVSTKRAELERKEDLLRRIDEAAKVLPLDRLALSPQCGFASTMEGNLLSEAEQMGESSLSWIPQWKSGAERDTLRDESSVHP